MSRNKEDIINEIKIVLKEIVAPTVAAHNGFINFLEFDEELGVVKLEMAGSCSGCAMSKQTLHNGVENMLKHYVPEVNAITAVDDTSSKEKGYTPYFPG